MRPADMPPAERYEHGTRARYVCGCRCEPCRIANREYARSRYRAQHVRKEWNGLVSADKARAHLAALSEQGIGRRAVGEACDVNHNSLAAIIRGKKTQIRAETEKRILAVDSSARADGSQVPGRRTWNLIGKLLEMGFSKASLAKRLGYESPAIQIKRKVVLARTAQRVERLYRQMMHGSEGELETNQVEGLCLGCGLSHRRQDRLKLLTRMLPCTPADIQEAYPCLYGQGSDDGAGYQRLMRDLRELRQEPEAK